MFTVVAVATPTVAVGKARPFQKLPSGSLTVGVQLPPALNVAPRPGLAASVMAVFEAAAKPSGFGTWEFLPAALNVPPRRGAMEIWAIVAPGATVLGGSLHSTTGLPPATPPGG